MTRKTAKTLRPHTLCDFGALLVVGICVVAILACSKLYNWLRGG
jgi:hypothetical protein